MFCSDVARCCWCFSMACAHNTKCFKLWTFESVHASACHPCSRWHHNRAHDIIGQMTSQGRYLRCVRCSAANYYLDLLLSLYKITNTCTYWYLSWWSPRQQSFRFYCLSPNINHYIYLQYHIYCIIMYTTDPKYLAIYLISPCGWADSWLILLWTTVHLSTGQTPQESTATV